MRSHCYHIIVLPATILVVSLCTVADAQWDPSYDRYPRESLPARLPSVGQSVFPQDAHRPFQPATYSPHEELPPAQRHPAATTFAPEHEPESQPTFDAMAIDVMPPPDFKHYGTFDDSIGPSVRVFEPKARVYFDTGFEAPAKLDIFHDGSLAPSINVLELYWARPWPEEIGHPDWRWGPNIGVGISSRAGDSSDGSTQASGAPVLMLSYGLLFEFPLSSPQIDAIREDPNYGPAAANRFRRLSPKAGVEFGYALGVSSDESLDYSADGAIYVGVTLHVSP